MTDAEYKKLSDRDRRFFDRAWQDGFDHAAAMQRALRMYAGRDIVIGIPDDASDTADKVNGHG